MPSESADLQRLVRTEDRSKRIVIRRSESDNPQTIAQPL
jgi:hypothetical protein